MLRLTRIEEGACYFNYTTNLLVAWSMLYYASKLFWGCDAIKRLDDLKSFHEHIFDKDEPTFQKLIELYKSFESPVLDAIRIMICFENYFKAKLLLNGYVIHQMDRNYCREHHPQFLTGNIKKSLLQDTTPILLKEVKEAEKHLDFGSRKPLYSLTKYTIKINTFLKKFKYQMIYSTGNSQVDEKLISVLGKLNDHRNSLHFLNIEYLGPPGNPTGNVNDLTFLRDYVLKHIDDFGNKLGEENKGMFEIGERQIEYLFELETEDGDIYMDGN